MPTANLIVLGFVLSMFVVFMIALGGITWWSERPAKAAATPRRGAASPARAAGQEEMKRDLAA